MRRLCYWLGVVLAMLLCRHLSFWAVFGWGYAAATVILVVVCFKPRRGERRKTVSEDVAPPMQVQRLEMDGG